MSSSVAPYFSLAVSFIEASKKIVKEEELNELFLKYIKQLGFSMFSCASYCDVENPPQNAVMIVEYPDEWLRHYIDSKYINHDKILATSLERITPFYWQDDTLRKSCSPIQLQIFNEAKEIGLIHGISFPIHSPGFYPSSVSVVGEHLDCDPDAKHALHLMSLYLFEAATRIAQSKYQSPHKTITYLTAREKECLQWAAEGKSDTVIADILNISARTVHFHIENAKLKYGVSSRTQAIIKAFCENQLISL